MTKKRNLIIFSRGLVTVLILLLLLSCLSNIFEKKSSRNRFQEFYMQQENIDVLLLGTSHMFNAISPMDMWEENGIVAYNLGVPGCRIPSSYWLLKNALQYTHPRLVVLDCAYLYNVKTNDNINYMHTLFDSMPLSRTKIAAIMDLYEHNEDRMRFLFPFSLYHNRWNELTKSDFFYKAVLGKMGFVAECDVVDAVLPDFATTEVQTVDNISTQYLTKIIELCNQQNIKLLFTFLPFNVNKTSKNDAAYIQMIAAQNEIPYLGPQELLQYLNPKTDFSNNYENNSHLNLSGAHKISYFLGDYIANNFSIPDQRQNPNYNPWHQYYSYYQDYKLSLLNADDITLESYLVRIANINYDIIIYLNDTLCLNDNQINNLIRNLGINLSEEIPSQDLLLIKESTNESINNPEIQITETGEPSIFLNNEMIYRWDDSIETSDIFVLVMERDSDRILDAAAFSYTPTENAT